MTAQLFDIVVGIYGQMLQGGLKALIPAGMGLLIAAAVIEARWGIAWAMIDGYPNFVRATGVLVAIIVQVAVVGYLIVNINRWTTDVMTTFLTWSAQASGLMNAREIIWNRPSTMIDAGFILLEPLKHTIKGAGALDQAAFLVLYVIGVLFFVGIATTIMLTQIWFILAVLAGSVLLGLIALRWTMFLSSGVIAWIGSTAVRVFVLGLTVSGTIIFLGTIPALHGPNTLVTLESALLTLGVAFVCFCVCWFTPTMAAHHMGGGGSMGVGHLLAGPLAVFGVATAGTRVISGISSMIRR